MTDQEAALSLMNTGAVRERAHRFLDLGIDGRLEGFTLDLDRLDDAADRVAAVTRSAYPDLDVPFHARWRHVEAGGHDRWGAIADAMGTDDPRRYGRAAFDLAIVSVLLDAGAGAAWRYRESATGETWSRSEGLAVASVDMLRSGLFSGVPADPFRADATILAAIAPEELGSGFQVGEDNPLVGLDGRCSLINRLGAVVADRTDLFAQEDDPRPGGLFDALVAEADVNGRIAAPRILEMVLEGLGAIWPGRITLGGVNLGDTWRHGAIETDDQTTGLMPFHKLSQWLTYSLIEPLQWTGVTVTDIDGLTGLAEYRNGGLFVDTGVLSLNNPEAAGQPNRPGDALIVEWRALTLALLDRIADPVRNRLDVKAGDFPLARVLEGGTWAAGRELAGERRSGGEPPIRIDSDGTVF